jgi:hypothetical protein
MSKTKKAAPSKKPAEKPASPPAPVAEKPPMTGAQMAEELKRPIPGPMHNHLFGRMLAVMRARGTDYPTESEKDFALFAFAGLKPENTAETLLCSQMVATWEAGMAMLTGSKMASDFQSMAEKGALAVKLLSIFERQFATLTKARKPPQTVIVQHEHRHIHVGGQAPGPTGDEIRIEGQVLEGTHPTALALAAAPALLGQDPPRDALPVAADKARPLPAARRRTRDRRPQR